MLTVSRTTDGTIDEIVSRTVDEIVNGTVSRTVNALIMYWSCVRQHVKEMFISCYHQRTNIQAWLTAMHIDITQTVIVCAVCMYVLMICFCSCYHWYFERMFGCDVPQESKRDETARLTTKCGDGESVSVSLDDYESSSQ